jgi:hypothetical protein
VQVSLCGAPALCPVISPSPWSVPTDRGRSSSPSRFLDSARTEKSQYTRCTGARGIVVPRCLGLGCTRTRVVGNGHGLPVQAHVTRRRSVDSTFHDGHGIGRAERQRAERIGRRAGRASFHIGRHIGAKTYHHHRPVPSPLLLCTCFQALLYARVTTDYTLYSVSRAIMPLQADFDFSTATKDSSCVF